MFWKALTTIFINGYVYRHIQDSVKCLCDCAVPFPQRLLFHRIVGTASKGKSHIQQVFQRLGIVLILVIIHLPQKGWIGKLITKQIVISSLFHPRYLQFLALLSFIETLILLFCWSSENHWAEKYAIFALCN